MLLLPAVQSAGELHETVAHAGALDAHTHDDASHAPTRDGAEGSLLHLLMHLPAASADISAVAHGPSGTAQLALIASPPAMPTASARESSEPSLPYRPPIVG